MKIFLLLIFSIFISFGVFAKIPNSIISVFNSNFKEIIVDVRGSRGGNGDVAAGYLTIMDLIQNYQIHSHITLLVDMDSKNILNRLAQGNQLFWSTVSMNTIDTLPNDKVFDLYLALASPSGTFRYGAQLREREHSELKASSIHIEEDHGKRINIKTEGVLIVQTVLGNTENLNSINPHAIVRSSGVNYNMSPAGIGTSEAGIYNDYIATNLRNKTPVAIQEFIKSQLSLIEDDFSRNTILKIVEKSKMKGAKIGLAYGISAEQTQSQFISYLNGLAADNSKSYCLITPSRFDEKAILDQTLYSKIQFITNEQSLPDFAEPGKIYIVRTKTMPHSVFVGLMAYSMKAGLVPVGAGDGFMSAAINLGGPFVLTRVQWNAKNISNLKSRLLNVAKKVFKDPTQLESVSSTFDSIFGKIDLMRAQTLRTMSALFETLSLEIPDLSERIINAAVMVSTQPKNNLEEFNKHTENISDSALKRSVRAGGLPGEIVPTKQLLELAQHAYKNLLGSAADFHDLFVANDDFFKLWDLPENNTDVEFKKKTNPYLFENILALNRSNYKTDLLFDKYVYKKFDFIPTRPNDTKKPEAPKSNSELQNAFIQQYFHPIKNTPTINKENSKNNAFINKCAAMYR